MTKVSPRKKPKQARSRATYQSILEATAQLLVEEGFHRMSTNAIAERAGVSIGSLYQYFPNKEAVVAGVIEDFADRQFEILARGVEEVVEEPSLDEAVATIVSAIIEAKRDEPQLSRVLFEQIPPIGQVDVWQQWGVRARQLVAAALELRRDELTLEVSPDVAAFLLVNACHGIVHGAVAERLDLLEDGTLVREMTRLVLHYIRG